MGASLALFLGLDFLGAFHGLNRSLADFSFRLRGPHAPDRTILLVAIDDRVLDKLGRWPIPRRHYARFLEATAEARAVGLDVIMVEPTEDDELLGKAIERHGRVVLPASVGKDLALEPVPAPLSRARRGHVQVEPDTDGLVRRVFRTMTVGGAELRSFSAVLFETASGRPASASKLTPGDIQASANILRRDPMEVDFYGPPGTFDAISFGDVLDGVYPPSFFKGKILLVGVTTPGLEDRMMIPFTDERTTMPGVEVHAHILNNLLDGTAIKPAGRAVVWPAAFLGGVFFFAFVRRRTETASALAWASALAGTALAVFLLFVRVRLWIPPGLVVASITAAFVSAYAFRLDEAVRRLDAKTRTLQARLGGAEQVPVSPLKGGGLAGHLSARGVNAKIGRLLAVEQAYEQTLEDTVCRRTEELAGALVTINEMSNEMIHRLTRAVESKEVGTGEHVTRIGLYAQRIARYLKLPGEYVEWLSFASPMHDLGKIGIPDGILLKDGALSAEEFAVMKEHTRIGERILAQSAHPKIQMSAAIALHHHEKWNGTGYPQGLRGQDIPLEARIVAVCDQYDSLRSARPYKAPYDHGTAVRVILQGDGRTRPEHFDPDVLRAFIDLAPVFKEIFDSHPSL